MNNLASGQYRITRTEGITNSPFEGVQFSIIVIDDGDRCYQLAYRSGAVKQRIKWGVTWSDWALVYDTSLLTNSTQLRALATALKPILDSL